MFEGGLINECDLWFHFQYQSFLGIFPQDIIGALLLKIGERTEWSNDLFCLTRSHGEMLIFQLS